MLHLPVLAKSTILRLTRWLVVVSASSSTFCSLWLGSAKPRSNRYLLCLYAPFIDSLRGKHHGSTDVQLQFKRKSACKPDVPLSH